MKKKMLWQDFCCAFDLLAADHGSTDSIVIKAPAQEWIESFPVGTGRLAAMVTSQRNADKLFLNHEALWTTRGAKRTCTEMANFLPEIRELLAAHKSNEATDLMIAKGKTLNSAPGTFLDPYMPAGEIELIYLLPEKGSTSFQRSLDFPTGYAHAQCDQLVRSFYGNPANDLLEGVIETERPIDVELKLSRRATREKDGDSRPVFTFHDGLLKLSGTIPDEVHYCVACRVSGDFSHLDATATGVKIAGVKKLLLRCNIGRGDTLTEAEREASIAAFDTALFHRDRVRRDELYRKKYLDAASLEIAVTPEIVRYFNFAKHLYLNGAWRGSYPLNLQGKWNIETRPPWDCAYFFDINLQMTYWPALGFGFDRENLAMVKFLTRMYPGAREGAKKMFGCRGLWLPYTADPSFRPAGASAWGVSPCAVAWLAAHFYQQYRYTQDLKYLRDTAFPFLREAILFFEDYLTYRADGTACISPSVSPENCYVGAEKYPIANCENASIDVELVGELLDNGIAASRLLDADPAQREKWIQMRQALPPLKIGGDGRLLEWENEVKEIEPGHRHMSHLYGVWPGYSIRRGTTPELFAAAKKSFDFRLKSGGGQTGWSRAWCANFRAIFGDGNGALAELQSLVSRQSTISLLDKHPYDNGFGAVFQIDGNFGGAMAVFNMLLQDSANGDITLLPALPDEWADGAIHNLRAPGGFKFDFSWKAGRVEKLTLTSQSDRRLKLTCNGITQTLSLKRGENTIVF
ncbi:MAG: glycoside hydrolase family 95 protein [Victivallaceae bacterium]|nr:glycoside hydrolase family 95 protein [Victivallaceae bacterium]